MKQMLGKGAVAVCSMRRGFTGRSKKVQDIMAAQTEYTKLLPLVYFKGIGTDYFWINLDFIDLISCFFIPITPLRTH